MLQISPFLSFLTIIDFAFITFASDLTLHFYRRNSNFSSPQTSLFTASKNLVLIRIKNSRTPKRLHPSPKRKKQLTKRRRRKIFKRSNQLRGPRLKKHHLKRCPLKMCQSP
jgi:hypothetical protein